MHWSSERRPFQVTGTSTGSALRTTTSGLLDRLGAVLAGPDPVLPEAIFTTRDSGRHVKVHAGWVPDSCQPDHDRTAGPGTRHRRQHADLVVAALTARRRRGARWPCRRIFFGGATGPSVTDAAPRRLLPGGGGARLDRRAGVVLAGAADEPGDPEDEQEGDAEHDASAYPVDASGQPPTRMSHRAHVRHRSERSAPIVAATPSGWRSAGAMPEERTGLPVRSRRALMVPMNATAPRPGAQHRAAPAGPGLVRRARPRPPLAASGGHPVGGDGLGVHAPADPGRPGAAGLRDAGCRTWPTPGALAAAPSGEAVRAWGRLGYPRRALRLHAAATAIVERHDGAVPSPYEELLALPGVGDYTASAIASFAFGASHAVLDTNVRRVLARAVGGEEFPADVGDQGRAGAGRGAGPRRARRPPGRSR